MVVGEKGYPRKAYVYVESGEGWSRTATLSSGGSTNSFGEFVAVYDTTIVISNHLYNFIVKGNVHVFKLISGKATHILWHVFNI